MSEKPRDESATADERPPAPWGSFPLAELTVLAGIVALVVGVVSKSPTAIGIGVVLAALGGLEVSAREHFAGYRSHTTLLAGTAFVLVTGALFYLAGLILAVCLAAGAVAFSPLPSTSTPRLPESLRRPLLQGRRPPGLSGPRQTRTASRDRGPSAEVSRARWRGVSVPIRLFSLRATA